MLPALAPARAVLDHRRDRDGPQRSTRPGAASALRGRQLVGLALGLALGLLGGARGGERILRAAPVLFVVALLATAAVFVPGIGVRAAGASRWLKLGRFRAIPRPS